MNTAVNAATAAAATANEAALDNLLADLGVDGNNAASLNDVDPLADLDDKNLETIEGAGDTGLIVASGTAELVEPDTGAVLAQSTVTTAIPVDAKFDTDALQEAIEGAAVNAVVVPPKNKGGKKGAGKKKGTSVPQSFIDASKNEGADKGDEKPNEDAGVIGAKTAEPGETPATDAEKPAAAPKAPRATSVTHRPGDLLVVKLGDAAKDLLVFDVNHKPAQVDAARESFIAKMNITDSKNDGYIADKVKDKMQMFLCWLAKGGELNEVLKRSIVLLHKDGKLTSGDKGNLHLNLLAKPYSQGTARSQGNQMFMAMPELGLTIKTKGAMEPNPNSQLLAMAYGALGLK